MKKILFLAGFSLITFSLFAQPGYRIGVKGGYNSTWLLNKSLYDAPGLKYAPSFDWHAGVSLGYNAKMYNFGYTTGIFLHNFTQKFEEDASIVDWTDEYKLSYLAVPLLFRIRPSTDFKTRSYTYGGFYFEAGAQAAYMLSATRNFEDKDNGISYSNRDVSEQFNPFNVFGIIGFGFHHIAVEHLAVTHGLRFSYGFLDVVNQESTSTQPIIFMGSGESTRAVSGGYILSIAYKF